MTTTTANARERGAYTPTVGSLLNAELLRVRSRRFVRWAALGVLGILVLVAVINFFQTAKPTTAQINQAKAFCANATSSGAFDESGSPIPGAELAECSVRDAAETGAFEKRPALRSDLPDEILGMGLGIAVLGFVLGCTLGGADWSQKTMTALLFWEPRRVRVFTIKLVALLLTLVAFLVVAEVAWVILKSILIATHGVSDPTPNLAQDAFTNLGRSLVLVLTMGAFAYGLASLARNTGAALGVGFVYFAIVETFIQWLLPRFAPWMLTTNFGALLTPGGLHAEDGGLPHDVSSVHGGIVLVVYATVICVVGLELFRRRDVT